MLTKVPVLTKVSVTVSMSVRLYHGAGLRSKGLAADAAQALSSCCKFIACYYRKGITTFSLKKMVFSHIILTV
ncbi:MAG: hypothetical protein ACM3PT_07390 [Deltaproteobacteria bacterium]